MNKKILVGVTTLGLMLAYALPFSVGTSYVKEVDAAQSDYYLKIEGVDGEAVSKGHEKEMQLMSWSFGASNPSSMKPGSGMGAGKVSMQDFHFTKMIDKASPILFMKLATGEHLKKATVTVAKPSSDGKSLTFMTYTFEDVLVTSWQNSADPLIEEVSFTFQKIMVEYKPQKADGSLDVAVKAGWDIKTNKGF